MKSVLLMSLLITASSVVASSDAVVAMEKIDRFSLGFRYELLHKKSWQAHVIIVEKGSCENSDCAIALPHISVHRYDTAGALNHDIIALPEKTYDDLVVQVPKLFEDFTCITSLAHAINLLDQEAKNK